jgi:hypothetical protein
MGVVGKVAASLVTIAINKLPALMLAGIDTANEVTFADEVFALTAAIVGVAIKPFLAC